MQRAEEGTGVKFRRGKPSLDCSGLKIDLPYGHASGFDRETQALLAFLQRTKNANALK
jgi:hypothetical protein